MISRRRLRADEIHGFRHCGIKPDRLDRDAEAPRLDPGEIKHLVDQTQQVTPSPEHLADTLLLPLRELIHLEQLGEPQDGVQRSPELMAHPRQKLALGQVGPLCLLPSRGRGPLGQLALGDVDRVNSHGARGPGGLVVESSVVVEPAHVAVAVEQAMLVLHERPAFRHRPARHLLEAGAIVLVYARRPCTGGSLELRRLITQQAFDVGTDVVNRDRIRRDVRPHDDHGAGLDETLEKRPRLP